MTESEVYYEMSDTRKRMRIAFIVPEFDAQVAEWVKNQQNTSLSMRLLIKDHIARYGMGDITALPMMIDESSHPVTSENRVIKYTPTTAASVTETAPVSEIKQEIIPEPKPEPAAVPVPKPAPTPASDPVLDLTQAKSNTNQSEPTINPMLASLMN